MAMKKIRLDLHLSQNGLSQSREKARREIIAGWVRVDGETVTDPSKLITGAEKVIVARPGGLYVSRGGLKLKHAIDLFGIALRGRVAVDLGASTGGFTDCMLKEGASRVYAVDVGYGQLDYSLRTDPRVTVMEKTNVRGLTTADFPVRPDFIAADLSFISISKVFDTIHGLFSPADGVILIKPQFEAGPGEHKKGVVRKIDSHREILFHVLNDLDGRGMAIRGLAYSPLKGPKGNIEFLLYFSIGAEKDQPPLCGDALEREIGRVVDTAHRDLQ